MASWLARAMGTTSTKAAGVPSISEDGSFWVAPWFSWLGFGTRTRAGTTISEDTALAIPTVYACVRVLAESIASLPLIVYKRLPSGGKERAPEHHLYDVLHDSPNSEMTSFAWIETFVTHLTTWGNAYNEVLTDRTGKTSIWPVHPAQMEIKWEGGRKHYDLLTAGGDKRRLKTETILHIPGLSTTGIRGISPIQQHREALGEVIATREFSQSFYRNSARPAVVMEHPKTLSLPAIERLATQMDQLRGSGNAGKTIVAEEGMKLHEVGIPPEDAQYIETRRFQREDICAIYRMPPHMVGILDHATFSNIEHQSIDFVVHTLRPWLVRIERALKMYFFADDQEHFAEFLVDGLLRGDAVTRAQALDIQRKAGVITKHEWQAIENRNPTGEDDIWVPDANYHAIPIDADGFPIEEPEPEPALVEPLIPEPDIAGAPALSVVKSTGVVRCGNCKYLLADRATPPYRLRCRNCRQVTEAA